MAGPGEERDAGDVPVGRLAPSPTGALHLGHARSFLLAWWSVRARGGVMRLRVEDLDAARARRDLVDQALADLAWLGLTHDGEVVHQSADLAPYEEAVAALVREDAAYACVCSRREIEAASAPHQDGGETRYPGTCRGRFSSPEAARRESGSAAGVRLRVPTGSVAFADALHGPVEVDVQAEVGDFLLKRRDGVFAYQLAVVVDDARMGVTEVLRGEDLLTSGARQALVQDALALDRPTYIHVPVVQGDDGRRLAKRDGAFALATLREEGVDPRAVVTWAARSVGIALPEGELFDAASLTSSFDLSHLPREPVVFGAKESAALRRWRR